MALRHLTFVQARLVQLMQKLSPDHFDWATSIVLGRYPGAVQVVTAVTVSVLLFTAISLRMPAGATVGPVCVTKCISYMNSSGHLNACAQPNPSAKHSLQRQSRATQAR